MSREKLCEGHQSTSRCKDRRHAENANGGKRVSSDALRARHFSNTSKQVLPAHLNTLRRVAATTRFSQCRIRPRYEGRRPTGASRSFIKPIGTGIYSHVSTRSMVRLPRNIKHLGVMQPDIPVISAILERIYYRRVFRVEGYDAELATLYHEFKRMGWDDLYTAINEVAEYERLERSRNA